MTLKTISLDDPALDVAGALDIQRSVDRILVRRLPSWTRAQTPEPAFDLMVAMGSGVRLRLMTDAAIIEVDAVVTGLQFGTEPRRPVVFDFCENGVLSAREETASGHTIVVDGSEIRFVPGSPLTLRFSATSDGPRVVEIWFPQSALTEIQAVRLSADADLTIAPSSKPLWAQYGSSITHGMEAEGPSDTWPAVVARQADLDLTNLGLAGQCHLDGFVARTLRDGPFDLIGLELGANIVASDSMRRRTFVSAVHSTLDTIRDRKPNTPIFIMSPIHSPLVDDRPGPLRRRSGGGYERMERPEAVDDGALTLASVREILQSISTQRKTAGDTNLHYLDGLTLFGAAEMAMMPDQLHPDADGHQLLGDRFARMMFGETGPLRTWRQAEQRP
ncbi:MULTISPECIES: SGNH/GDSL hydrolase family protein [unclassified Sphingomonas]|uniref:SGNH/GDSL hydrolase family protein n=1 Tax=unclassified Sphingomonas TaxID=196159 RepID=UPI000BC851D1|nr:MAG: hypothetical protein B7Y98_10510 [Sphingomonas sp. 32-62-10]